jgi:tRNA threonylcarbamoyladenosine biosynthesis protein TsaB
MNTLYIDTRNNKEIIVRLKVNGDIFEEVSAASKNNAQATLPIIEKLLERVKLGISDIDEINIERGPGSFTGLRVGISIANALSFAGLIRVNGKKLGKIEEPQY